MGKLFRVETNAGAAPRVRHARAGRKTLPPPHRTPRPATLVRFWPVARSGRSRRDRHSPAECLDANRLKAMGTPAHSTGEDVLPKQKRGHW